MSFQTTVVWNPFLIAKVIHIFLKSISTFTRISAPFVWDWTSHWQKFLKWLKKFNILMRWSSVFPPIPTKICWI